ncbi:MAG: hypothetical protein M1370_09995 [Bacteroidetes bacterium]|nr:hypothetical protein [Bacteroidota bacterium]MCL5025007.1 hypothetical protein [Chloroflexota bacterium]
MEDKSALDRVRVLIVGDDDGACQLLHLVLHKDARIAVVGQASGTRDVTQLTSAVSPDVALVDLDATDQTTLAALKSAKQQMGSVMLVGLAGNLNSARTSPGEFDAMLDKREPLDKLLTSLSDIGARHRHEPVTPERRADPAPEAPENNDGGPVPLAPRPVAVHTTATPEGEKAADTKVTGEPPAVRAGAVIRPGDGTAASHTEGRTEGGRAERIEGVTSALFTGPAAPQSSQPQPGADPHLTVAASPAGSAEPAPVVAANSAAVNGQITPILVELSVSQFGSFRTLSAFHAALEGLSDILMAKIRRFHRGTLYEVVRYAGTAPLEERLKELTQYQPTLVASRPGSIELRIKSSDDRTLEASTPD